MSGTSGAESRSLGTGLFLGTNDRNLCRFLRVLFVEKTGCRRYQADGRLRWSTGNLERDSGSVYRNGTGTFDGVDHKRDPKKRIFTNEESGAEVGTVSIGRILFFMDLRSDLTGHVKTL